MAHWSRPYRCLPDGQGGFGDGGEEVPVAGDAEAEDGFVGGVFAVGIVAFGILTCFVARRAGFSSPPMGCVDPWGT